MEPKLCPKCGGPRVVKTYGRSNPRLRCVPCYRDYCNTYYHTVDKDKALARAGARNRTDKGRSEQKTYRQNHYKARYAKLKTMPMEMEKNRARASVGNAIRDGRLIRPDHCSRCLTRCKPHGHHSLGYARAHWLDVVWLCVPCHEREHHARGQAARP